MKKADGRKLGAREQQALRERAVRRVREGTPQTEVARELGVSRSAVAKWMCAYREGGERALASRMRGRPPGTGVLTDAERRRIFRTVCRHLPKQVGFAEELWTNKEIRHLLLRDLQVTVTAMTMSLWMRQWGFVGPQPAANAVTQYDEETSQMALWDVQEYPKVRLLARKNKARIVLLDERLLPKQPNSEPPVLPMICAVDGPGTLYFRVGTHPVTYEKHIDFLRRLRLDIGRPLVVLLGTRRGNPRPSSRAWRQQDIGDITLAPIPVRDLQHIPRECWPFRKVRSEARHP